jgi:hypothetical protein
MPNESTGTDRAEHRALWWVSKQDSDRDFARIGSGHSRGVQQRPRVGLYPADRPHCARTPWLVPNRPWAALDPKSSGDSGSVNAGRRTVALLRLARRACFGTASSSSSPPRRPSIPSARLDRPWIRLCLWTHKSSRATTEMPVRRWQCCGRDRGRVSVLRESGQLIDASTILSNLHKEKLDRDSPREIGKVLAPLYAKGS